MSTYRSTHRHTSDHPELAEVPGAMLTATATKALAVLRVLTGAIFLWAFLDKTFGLGYSTPSSRSWIHGGSPTKGFLSSVEVGPLRSIFHSIAGAWWADSLFMLGLLGIGVALLSGVAVRLSAAAGVAMMALMWLAEFPPARHASGGTLSGSTNPLIDYHMAYAVVLIVLAVTYAGTAWGLGGRWARLRFVAEHRWML